MSTYFNHGTTLPAYQQLPEGVAWEDWAKHLDTVKWSNSEPPPAIGATITIKLNGIGPARVLGYFQDANWLGCIVLPLSPPAWYVKQTKQPELGAHVFGAEIKAA